MDRGGDWIRRPFLQQVSIYGHPFNVTYQRLNVVE